LVLTYGPASASSRAGAWTGRRSCCAMVGSKGCSWRRRRPVGAEGAGVSGWKSGGELDGVSGEVSVWSSEADGPVGPGGGAASGAGGGGGGGRTLARVAAVRCMGGHILVIGDTSLARRPRMRDTVDSHWEASQLGTFPAAFWMTSCTGPVQTPWWRGIRPANASSCGSMVCHGVCPTGHVRGDSVLPGWQGRRSFSDENERSIGPPPFM
jgi:hypothetical protein